MQCGFGASKAPPSTNVILNGAINLNLFDNRKRWVYNIEAKICSKGGKPWTLAVVAIYRVEVECGVRGDTDPDVQAADGTPHLPGVCLISLK